MFFFSIIIPTYNSEKTLKQCLKTVLEQSFSDFEVLIIDSCSNDSTLEIIKNINDIRLKIFSEKDNGIYDAMNKGISLSNGKWLYFLGSDDELSDYNVFFDVASFIEEEKQLSLVYGNVILKKNNSVYGGKFDRVKLCLKNICHQAIFYKKEIFNCLGLFNTQFKIWADWDFNMRCFLHPDFQIKFIDRIIAIYNNETGASTEFDPLLKMERIEYHIDLERKYIYNSKTYRLGNFILRPFKLIRKFSKH